MIRIKTILTDVPKDSPSFRLVHHHGHHHFTTLSNQTIKTFDPHRDTRSNHKIFFSQNTETLGRLKGIINDLSGIKVDSIPEQHRGKFQDVLAGTREFVMMAVQTMDIIGKAYKAQCKDVVTLTSNLPGVELPDDWKDDVTQVFTKANK